MTDQSAEPPTPPTSPTPPGPMPPSTPLAGPPPEGPPQETVALPWGIAATPQPPSTDGTAVLALVLAILSWLLLPVVLAIVALVLAGNAARQIEASGGARSGLGLVTAARWIAWINLLVAAMVIAFVAAFAVALAIAR